MKMKSAKTLLVSLVLPLFALWSTTGSTYAYANTPSGINGQVWVDFDGSGHFDSNEPALVGVPVFVERLPQSNDDVVMTMVVYTDENGRYAFDGLDDGVYQIWTESATDTLFYLVITIDENTPVAMGDLPVTGHQLYVPFVTAN
ncbi:MAG: SdrD B-like domain-containing protein [Caldilineaceae bacterium]